MDKALEFYMDMLLEAEEDPNAGPRQLPQRKSKKRAHDKRGGKRPGSGRKKGVTFIKEHMRRVRIDMRLPRYMADWLRDQPIPPARVIEHILQNDMRFQFEHEGELPMIFEENLVKDIHDITVKAREIIAEFVAEYQRLASLSEKKDKEIEELRTRIQVLYILLSEYHE